MRRHIADLAERVCETATRGNVVYELAVMALDELRAKRILARASAYYVLIGGAGLLGYAPQLWVMPSCAAPGAKPLRSARRGGFLCDLRACPRCH